jgi:hypothetical protein
MKTAEKTFAGAGYDPQFDRDRLILQVERIRRYMLLAGWKTLREIKADLEWTYAPAVFPESSISAQLRNLRKVPLSHRLDKRRRAGVHGAGAGIWEYRLSPPEPGQQLGLFVEKKSERPPAAAGIDAGGESDVRKGREEFFSSHAGFDPSTEVRLAKKEGFFNG